MFAMILVAPIIQLIFLGYAANFDVNVVHTAVYDLDKSEASRKYLESFESTGYFSLDYYVDNYEQLTNHIDNAKVIMGLVIPRGFEEKINRRETVQVQAIFDGSDGNTASIAAGYLQGITQRYSKGIVTDLEIDSECK